MVIGHASLTSQRVNRRFYRADLMRGARTDSLNVASTSAPADEKPAAVQAGAAAEPCGGKASLADLITGCD